MNVFTLESNLSKALEANLNLSLKLDALVRTLEFLNKQWFLDWQDKLNELSVR